MCISQWDILEQLLVELKVVCTTTNLLFLRGFAMGCCGGGLVVGL